MKNEDFYVKLDYRIEKALSIHIDLEKINKELKDINKKSAEKSI
ncbi:MAG: hypothetical protein OEV44_10725 [Spirochaetota bacterium]|nr:hypothetical protein [Spirochaetota bacterium]